jgi:hypothetical protein
MLFARREMPICLALVSTQSARLWAATYEERSVCRDATVSYPRCYDACCGLRARTDLDHFLRAFVSKPAANYRL